MKGTDRLKPGHRTVCSRRWMGVGTRKWNRGNENGGDRAR